MAKGQDFSENPKQSNYFATAPYDVMSPTTQEGYVPPKLNKGQDLRDSAAGQMGSYKKRIKATTRGGMNTGRGDNPYSNQVR
jgi:hypothetical protein